MTKSQDHPHPVRWARKWFGYPTGTFCPTCIFREHPCLVASLLFIAALLYVATLKSSVEQVHESLRVIETRLGVMEQNPKVLQNRELNDCDCNSEQVSYYSRTPTNLNVSKRDAGDGQEKTETTGSQVGQSNSR